MKNGFIKLWRMSRESEIFNSGPEMWYLWSHILLNARGKPQRFQAKVGRFTKTILLDSGQMFFSETELAKKLKIKRSTLKYRLDKLMRMGMITRSTVYVEKTGVRQGVPSWGTGAMGSVLTVCNWWKYQSRQDSEKNDTLSGGVSNNKESTNKEELHTYQDITNKKNKGDEDWYSNLLSEVPQ